MNVDQALGQLVAADTVPTQGPELVSYLGGQRATVSVLTGLDRSPRRGDYGEGAEGAAQHKADYTRWRSTSRRVQRWTTEAGQQRGRQRVTLDPEQRREAERENRARKLQRVRQRGIRAIVHARIVVDSPGKGGRDSRHRTISDGGQGILVENGAEILALVNAGQLDEAQAALVEGFLDAVPLPAYTELTEASWELHPD